MPARPSPKMRHGGKWREPCVSRDRDIYRSCLHRFVRLIFLFMKYIRFKHRGFVVFEATQSHKEIAAMIGDEVVSAGFVSAHDWRDDGQVVCGQRSETLRVGAGPKDTDHLRLLLLPNEKLSD